MKGNSSIIFYFEMLNDWNMLNESQVFVSVVCLYVVHVIFTRFVLFLCALSYLCAVIVSAS